MEDQSSPILDIYDASQIFPKPGFDFSLDYKLQLNSFVDNDSIVGIFNKEPEPYNFFSVDSAKVEEREKMPQFDQNNQRIT